MSTASTLATRCASLSQAWLDQVMAIEQVAYSHPWTRGNFIDSLAAGYHAEVLLGQHNGQESVMGYFVAMQGVDEVHLLNITIAPGCQGHGWGRLLLETVCRWGQACQARWLWLEVRASNTRALSVYQRFGFRRVGERKNYYPLSPSLREDAVIMSLLLDAPHTTLKEGLA